MNLRFGLVAAVALALVAPVEAAPGRTPKRSTKTSVKKRSGKRAVPSKRGAAARVSFARKGELRTAGEPVGRRREPLTLEEETAKQIADLLRTPGLRNGVTGLYVADARTGQPLFAVNADEPLNPASNVKMISTAAALELLGPDFRYPTRLLGPAPVGGVVPGDVYLLGSHDPTLTTAHLDKLAAAMAARGITAVDGDIVVGGDPTRDGIFRAMIPIEIVAGEPGKPPTVSVPVGADHVSVVVKATTHKRSTRSRLRYHVETVEPDGKPPVVQLTISGTIGKGRSTRYALWTRERTATAVYALRAALRAHHVAITGDMKVQELEEFTAASAARGALPVELARHESRRLAEIVARINKWSINWLADRVIMTAAALSRQQPPSMDLAIEAMYGWLARHPHLAPKGIVLDTGSGLSYKTQITPAEIVAVIRSAAGFTEDDVDPSLAQAWLDSLAIARRDGTLRGRLRGTDARVRGKTGTLSTVIAMSGVLEVDAARPLAFSLVTNTDTPLSKHRVRQAHDKVMRILSEYLAKAGSSTAPTELPSDEPVDVEPLDPYDLDDSAPN